MFEEKISPIQEWSRAGKAILYTYGNFFYWLFKEKFPIKQIGEQFVRTMVDGFGTIMVGAFVQGLLIAWLAGNNASRFGAHIWIGTISTYVIFKETSVLMAGILYSSRVGTGFTVEIGSMHMTGQLDALRMMTIEPTQYIVIPRVLASIITLLFLKALSDGVAVISTMILIKIWFGVSFPIFAGRAFMFLEPSSLYLSYVRTALIAFFTSLNACALGYYFNGGAIELGKTTTKANVINIIYVLLIDLGFSIMLDVTGWA